uniref:Glycosyltransferase family 18 catalytic domain-containing protein n=1 Tax=Rhizochromulina marina TaxID=1034831 RepID=A0A7S2ST87_9STRA|mmetsp:Transcript_7160/g.20722  ORF Transcript_7160/g.20722 Transcript_7160/m.20722 type:complete len:152 (+) Transcript_7160:3-458(+)
MKTLHVYLVNVQDTTKKPSRYAALRPAGARVFLPGDFAGKMPPISREMASRIRPTAATAPGQSCSAVCGAVGMHCEPIAIPLVNNCTHLQRAFGCATCTSSVGKEQPAYVVPTAPASSLPDTCLFTSDPGASTCEASHPMTRRLCPCAVAA